MKFVKTLAIVSVSVFMLLALGSFDRVEALLDSHECTFCHNLHGGPGYETLLTAETSEQVCLSCHTVSINDTAAAEVHNPLGLASNQSGYITCRECHDAHSNQGGNIKLIGYLKDGENWFESFTTPAIRKELPSTIDLIYNVVTFTSSADFNIVGSNIGPCEVCHEPYHNAGNDCTQCHSHSGGFPKPDCTAVGCHDGNGIGALAVGVGSSHSTDTIFASKGITFTCGDCHTSHGTAGNVLIPNNTAVGINYNSAGHGGISLGSSVAIGATEAEICWNCHAKAAVGVSEWDLNTDTNGAGANNYDHGALSGPIAPAWVNTAGTTGATWTSAQTEFSYKVGPIGSTHSVNSSATGPGLDPVGSIRCSYCHDVHELNLASGDTTSGKPYLRGSWRGNPYLEDGAPIATSSYAPQHWGNVPRGSILNNELGGYQIDQNNSFPTAGGTGPTWNAPTNSWIWPAGLWSLNDSAGLCILCHTASVNSMDYFSSASADWVGTNGHSNAAIRRDRINAVNIFRTSWRAPSGVNTNGANPDMGYANHGAGVGYGFRGTDGRSFRLVPSMDGQLEKTSSRPYGGNHYQWGAAVDDTTTEIQYHQFSCSKCHNPHAAKLPRLMITNCLDTKLNTWDDPRTGMNAVNIGNSNNNGITLSAATSPDNWNRTWSNTTSAQNCHRLAGDNRLPSVPGAGSGWNNVTPW